MHFGCQRRVLCGDHPGGEIGKEPRLQFSTRAVDADFLIGYRCQQQETVIGNTPPPHVGFDDASRLANRVREFRAVGADNQRQIRHVQEIEAATEADHPFAVLDVGGTVHLSHFGDVRQIPGKQGQQIATYLLRHLGEKFGER